MKKRKANNVYQITDAQKKQRQHQERDLAKKVIGVIGGYDRLVIVSVLSDLLQGIVAVSIKNTSNPQRDRKRAAKLLAELFLGISNGAYER
jgi:hypothetical protein